MLEDLVRRLSDELARNQRRGSPSLTSSPVPPSPGARRAGSWRAAAAAAGMGAPPPGTALPITPAAEKLAQNGAVH
jgi:hypothetical protein